MTARVRVSRPQRGWLKFVWQSPKDIDPSTRKALDFLEQVPGVRMAGMVLEVPSTVFALDQTKALLDWDRTSTPHALFGCVGYNSRPDLFAWQNEAIKFATEQSGGHGILLADEMGLGKSRTAACAADVFSDNDGTDRPNYVVAPLFTLSTWRRELVLAGVIEREEDLCVLRTKDHRVGFDPNARWYFIHYDVLPYWASRLSMHRRGKPCAVILDEVHRLQNPSAQRSKAAMLLASGALFRMALTGTPMDETRDLFFPLSLVTGPYTWGSYSVFRERYCGAVNVGFGLQDTGPSNIEELRERMAPFYLRRTIASSGAKLPPLVRKQVTAFLTPAQRTKHDEALGGVPMSELVQAILEGRAGKKTLETLMHVRKVTGAAKTATTVDLVADLAVEQNEDVVVFCWQPEKAEDLAEKIALASHRPGKGFLKKHVVHGGHSQSMRDLTIQSWQQVGGVLVATYGVLREGVTLTKARHVVLHDLDWTPSIVLQAEARVYRISQDRPTFSHWVTAEDSIDTLLARVLVAKAEQASKTLDLGEGLAAIDELQLKRLVEDDFDPAEWAKSQLARWRHVE